MLDTTHLRRGMLWTWRVVDGKLQVREAGGDWIDVGVPGDLRALFAFFDLELPPQPMWMPWHPIRDWWLRRRAKQWYRVWYETKHRLELEQKRKLRLAQLKDLYVRKTP